MTPFVVIQGIAQRQIGGVLIMTLDRCKDVVACGCPVFAKQLLHA